MFNFIKDHSLWKSIDFWEEHFWKCEVSRVRKQGSNLGCREAAVAMCYNAASWGVSYPKDTTELLTRLIESLAKSKNVDIR